MPDGTTRRRWLTGLAGAGTAAMSGCIGTIEGLVDDGGLRDGTVEAGSVPAYASLVPAENGVARLTAHDLTTEGDHALGTRPEEPFPLRFDGASGAVAARTFAAFFLGLGGAGFSPDRFDLNATAHVVTVDGVGAD